MAFDDLRPSIKIEVEGEELDQEITQFITDCTVDQAVDMADQINLTVLNPPIDIIGSGAFGGNFLFLAQPVFQPGNVIKVSMGYGDKLKYLGGGIIQKFMPSFPSSGTPTLSIRTLDGSYLMMEGNDDVDALAGQSWADVAHSDIVLDIASRYGFVCNVDGTEATNVKIVKKAGTSDYKFIKGLANINGFQMRVYLNESSNVWTLDWKKELTTQEKKYTFAYAAGQASSLLEFEPQLALQGTPSGVQVSYYDKDTNAWEDIKIEDNDKGEDPKYKGTTKDMTKEITSSSALRLSASGKFIEVVAERPFQSAADAVLWAERWFQRRKDNFIMGRGKIIGIETLRPFDTHAITGVGPLLSGDYFFTSVKHVFSRDNGYRTEFFANKILE